MRERGIPSSAEVMSDVVWSSPDNYFDSIYATVALGVRSLSWLALESRSPSVWYLGCDPTESAMVWDAGRIAGGSNEECPISWPLPLHCC